jgi:PAS domain S-box-containing protein
MGQGLEKEEELRELGRRSAVVLNGAAEGVIALGRAGSVVFANPCAAQLFGCAPEDLAGLSFHAVARPSRQDGVPYREEDNPILDVLTQGNARRGYGYFHRPSDGSCFPVEFCCSPVSDPERVVAAVVVFRDISERRRAEDALRESEERLRAILSSLQETFVALLNWDGAYIEVWSTPELDKRFGIDSKTLKGQGAFAVLDEDEARDRTERVRRIFETGESNVRETYTCAPNGSFWLEVSLSPLWGADGKVAAVVACVRDITGRKEAEEREKLRQRQMVQADKMVSLGILVAGVAHEINNPNNFIMLNAPLLKEAWRDALPILDAYYRENGEFLIGGLNYSEMRGQFGTMCDGVIEGSRWIRNIVHELRDFAQEGSADATETVDVNMVVKSATTLVSNMLSRCTDHFTVHYGVDLPLLRGSFQRLEQVAINLLQNACQALPDRSRAIAVRTLHDRDERQVILEVEDQGSGFSEEAAAHLCDPFFTTKREEGGTGLGLSISSTIAHEHGGSLEFESRPGAGTRARLRLPAEALEEKAEQASVT